MYYGVKLNTNYKTLWQEGMKDWDGNLPVRMTDDVKEEGFWNAFMKKKEQAGVDSWVANLRKELIALIDPGEDVLEIGPGWGNYTFEAAEKAGSLTCVDSSESVLAYLKAAAERKGWNHLNFVHAKWEELPKVERADVVFGVNCYYRMQEIDRALLHINNTAKRLGIAGMVSGPERPHYKDIQEQLGCRIKFQRRDYIHLQNLLYELGIDANCKMVNLHKTYAYDTEEELLKDNLSAVLDKEYDRRKAIDLLYSYVREEDGRLIYPHNFKAALLYWKPEKRLEPADLPAEVKRIVQV
ncbi:class I SAM-dependent methyltransferase [Paenibacillus chitinolyticus]|uniref:class I SAM-dependent methyltransferase n=1 Tax=Paenibacillus chitinolyticus TaxID=79263 RepID=UPI001C47B5DE|nr:class I SAM-dependent methyltransferase [Paenibacillus chitinolyticus]MBV6713244.1 class I SAM-dependent methyltransferase [Paenibacillus chitinolyticus]